MRLEATTSRPMATDWTTRSRTANAPSFRFSAMVMRMNVDPMSITPTGKGWGTVIFFFFVTMRRLVFRERIPHVC
jgi:hypothetical protein